MKVEGQGVPLAQAPAAAPAAPGAAAQVAPGAAAQVAPGAAAQVAPAAAAQVAPAAGQVPPVATNNDLDHKQQVKDMKDTNAEAKQLIGQGIPIS